VQHRPNKSLPAAARSTTPTTGVASSRTESVFHSPCTRIVLVLTIVMLALYCRPLPAQTGADQSTQPQVEPATIQSAISRLGDAAPSIRQNAQEKLRQIGPAAIEELEKAAKFETTLDYETQIAAAKILELIREKIAIEETDKFVRGETSLLGWQAFAKFTGDNPESRSLFRDIYLKNQPAITNAIRPDTKNAVSYGLLRELFESSNLEQVCLGMFLLAHQQTEQNAAHSDTEPTFLHDRPSELQLAHLLSSCARQTSPLSKLRTNVTPVALLVRAVIETAPKEQLVLNRKLELMQVIKSPAIGPLLIKFAAPENPTVVRALTIAHAIKIGDADTFGRLQTYLNDDTVVGQYLKPNTAETKDEPASQLIIEVQIRDIVLLGNLQLAGETPTDFGFPPEAINAGGNKVDIKRTGFSSDKDRKQAFERFQSSKQQ